MVLILSVPAIFTPQPGVFRDRAETCAAEHQGTLRGRAVIGMSVRRHSRAAGMSWTLLSSRGLELDHRFSGHLSAMLRLDALRLCRSRTSVPSARSPVSCVRPGWPPGTALARRAARSYRASASRSAWHDRRSSRSPAQCSPARRGGTVTFGLAADAMSQGSAGRQDGQ